MKRSSLKARLSLLNFLEFAVWGSYLISMGMYLGTHGLSHQVFWFYTVQGLVSIFMPALIGIVADRWIPAQKTLSICHFLAGAFMIATGVVASTQGDHLQFGLIFTLYTISVAFFMPTIGLCNSVAFNALEKNGMSTVTDFPPIRVLGTVGFIVAELMVNFISIGGVTIQHSFTQFYLSGIFSLLLACYALTMPNCPVNRGQSKSLADTLGLKAFKLFKDKQMAIFFIFSMLLGVALQITNGFATPYITSFKGMAEYANTFGANNATLLTSLSQISEALCILLIPFFLGRYGIKRVMLMAMCAWVLRFGFFGFGNPGSGLWMFILSMLVYGVAFDFFNVSGALFVEQETDDKIKASAQGLFMLMTNGIGASIGTLIAGAIVNKYVHWQVVDGGSYMMGDWRTPWLIFAGYALVVTVLFALVFKHKHVRPDKAQISEAKSEAVEIE